MTQTQNRRAILVPSLIWLGVLLAALFAGVLRGIDWQSLAVPASVAAIPALLGLFLSPMIYREWAQILILLVWLALAIVACLFFGFLPLAILFITAPIIAALFRQEKIVEALVIAAIFTALLYYASLKGAILESPFTDMQATWAKQTGIMGVIALTIGTLFANSQKQGSDETLLMPPKKASDDNPYETLSGSVLRFSKSGELITANRMAQSAFGINSASRPVAINSLLSHDAPEQSVLDATVQRATENGYSESIRLGLRGEAGDVSIFDTHIFPHKDGGVVLHAIDRTVEDQRIEELRRNHAVALAQPDDKTLFFAGVSHELRTPLNAIIGFSDMMRSRLFGPLPSKYAEYADLIHDSGQHMLDLIGDVLDLSKVEAGKYSLQYDMFDAADVIRSSVKMIRPAADAAEVKVDVAIDTEDTLLVEADRKAVRQILLNLLSNAVKFSGKGQRVAIKARHDDGYLVMRVEDQGEGISAEDLVTIGTPYTQSASGLASDERGSGLGLSLVKSLTELHRGEFDIESQVGEGTQVTISLPLSRAT